MENDARIEEIVGLWDMVPSLVADEEVVPRSDDWTEAESTEEAVAANHLADVRNGVRIELLCELLKLDAGERGLALLRGVNGINGSMLAKSFLERVLADELFDFARRYLRSEAMPPDCRISAAIAVAAASKDLGDMTHARALILEGKAGCAQADDDGGEQREKIWYLTELWGASGEESDLDMAKACCDAPAGVARVRQLIVVARKTLRLDDLMAAYRQAEALPDILAREHWVQYVFVMVRLESVFRTSGELYRTAQAFSAAIKPSRQKQLRRVISTLLNGPGPN